MIREAIVKVSEGKDLSYKEAKLVFLDIFQNQATPAQLAAFLTALRLKGESPDELLGAVTVIREKAEKLSLQVDARHPLFDTCGTGGSGVEKFNVSTAVAFVVSAGGVRVAKHGNRAASSHSGSADVLIELGIKIDAAPSLMQEAIETLGIGFLFAPLYHKAFKAVVPVRKEIGIRTIFNFVGPLCNPAAANYQLLGVSDRKFVPVLVEVLRKLKVRGAFVVHSDTLKDEISLLGPTYVIHLNRYLARKFTVNPSDFGMRKCQFKDIEAKTPQASAQLIRDIFSGKKCPARDIVVANAAACFYLLGKCDSLKHGVVFSESLLDQGKAMEKLQLFREFLHSHE